MIKLSYAALLFLGISLAGCEGPSSSLPGLDSKDVSHEASKQRSFALNELLRRKERLNRVAFRVVSTNASLCKEQIGSLGIGMITADRVQKKFASAASRLIGASRGAYVYSVAPGSPGAIAGVQIGDVITNLAGKNIRSSKDLARAVKLIDDGKYISGTLYRYGASQRFSAKPANVCGYPVISVTKDKRNAHTDGSVIVINSGIMETARTDEELALVVAHELAHIVSDHLSKKRTNRVAGYVGGFAVDLALAAIGLNTQGAFMDTGGSIGHMAYSRDFELESDYVGMYFLARAGFNMEGVEIFWRRMAAKDPRDISFASTHPGSAERFILLARTRDEINRKRQAGLVLLPNTKERTKHKKSKSKATRKGPLGSLHGF